nr:HEXXH motif-containing putative peptide modification protein [Actinophytocola sp.]
MARERPSCCTRRGATTPDPLSGILHGTYAFLGVADFWSREWPAAGRGAELTYARTVRQLHVGLDILRESTDLTPTGSALVPALGAEISRLPVTGLAADIRRLADDLVAHHRALWRLRQVEPDPAEVAALADDWLRGGPVGSFAAPDDRATTTTAPGGDSPLFRLATAWVENPDAVRAAAADPIAFDARYPDADPLDAPLVAGDYAEAQTTRLAGCAPDENAWASLSVAHGRLCGDPARSPLATRPELVRAAWPQVAELTGAATNPLAELVSRYVAGTSTSDSMRR